MKIKQQDGPPSDLLYFDNEMNLTNDHVEDIVEIFNTPLTAHTTGTIQLRIIELRSSMN